MKRKNGLKKARSQNPSKKGREEGKWEEERGGKMRKRSK